MVPEPVINSWSIPPCSVAGQVVTTDASGQLICRDLPTATLVLPKCAADERLTADGVTLSCMKLACP